MRYATPSIYNFFYGTRLPVSSNLKRLPRDDFLYPILPQFRIKEKLIPLNFYVPKSEFYKSNVYFDPYYVLYKSFFNPSAYFYLDLKIQNWLTFSNVIWNQNLHFFFKRSFKSDSSGLSFRLSGGSYKLFIGSSTLNVPRVGQYFYNYLPWLQYKFKWLLYPTATYKRFDNHRSIQYHYSKKFYYASLLKFYQIHFFRWQLAAKTFQWRTVQSRNFILHLFFYKQSELENLMSLKSFLSSFGLFNPNSSLNLCFSKDSLIKAKVLGFNSHFLNLKDRCTSLTESFLEPVMKKNSSDFYIPSFTQNDFRLFQFVSDLRRVNAMQTNSVRFWTFDRYLKFLGPVMYRSDITSLMGFFAPFEYRNQIILSRFKNDSIRFSVFFPSKNSQLVGHFGSSGTFLNKFSIFRRSVVERVKEDPIPKEVGHRFRAGVLSRSWNLGQGWLKFVVPQSINSPYHKSMSLFNFGLSGVGRLPRLSRSFFHMLFFRNKVQDFMSLKTLLLKVQLMSLPCFFLGFSENSFGLFWEFFLFDSSYKENSFSLSRRYLILFRMSNSYSGSYYLNFDSVFGKPYLGYFLSLSNYLDFNSNRWYNLWNQYDSIKAYNKFIFLNRFPDGQLSTSGSETVNVFLTRLPYLKFFNSNFFFFFLSLRHQALFFKYNLHWYFYPLAYFFVFDNFLSSLCIKFFSFFLVNNNFLFYNFDDYFSYNTYYALASFIGEKKLPSNLTEASFVVKSSSVDFNLLNNLFYFPYNFSSKKTCTFFDYYLSNPIISVLYFSSFSPSKNVSVFLNNFTNFELKTISNSRNLDGSGRFFRPKSQNFLINQIFTYREFEKFKKEHHRQRFRGVLPYWLQLVPLRKAESYFIHKRHTKFVTMTKKRSFTTMPANVVSSVVWSFPEKFLAIPSDNMERRYLPDRRRQRKRLYSKLRQMPNLSLFIPYQYSKWYTQNPKLSMCVSSRFVNLYLNNYFSELHNIYVHFLILLKRKIMFDIFSLKSVSHKHDVLYNLQFDLVGYNKYVSFFNSSFSKKFLDFFSEFFLVFYFYVCDFSSTFSFFPSLDFINYVFSLRSKLLFDFFLSANYLRLLYNPNVSKFLHSLNSLNYVTPSEKLARNKVYSDIALYGKRSASSQGFFVLGLRGNYTRTLDRYFRRYPFVNFYRSQMGLIREERILDNFVLRNVFTDFDHSMLRGDLGSSVLKKRSWRYLPFNIVSPQVPFSRSSTSLASVARFKHHHLFSFLRLLRSSSTNYSTLPVKLKLFIQKHNLFFLFSQKLNSFNSPAFKDFANFSSSPIKNINSTVNFPIDDLKRFPLYSSKKITFKWGEFRINPYHYRNWQVLLHKGDFSDFLGVRRYKVNTRSNLSLNTSSKYLKNNMLSYLLDLQIPLLDLNSLGRFPYKSSYSSNYYLTYFKEIKRSGLFSDVYALPSSTFLADSISVNVKFWDDQRRLLLSLKANKPWYDFESRSSFGRRLIPKFRRRHGRLVWFVKYIFGYENFGTELYKSMAFEEFFCYPEKSSFAYKFLQSREFSLFFPPFKPIPFDSEKHSLILKSKPALYYRFPFNPSAVWDFRASSLSKRLTSSFYSLKLSRHFIEPGYTYFLPKLSRFDVFFKKGSIVSNMLLKDSSDFANANIFYNDVHNFILSDFMRKSRVSARFVKFMDMPGLVKSSVKHHHPSFESITRHAYAYNRQQLYKKKKNNVHFSSPFRIVSRYVMDLRPYYKYKEVIPFAHRLRPTNKFIFYGHYILNDKDSFFLNYIIKPFNSLFFNYFKSNYFNQSIFLPNFQSFLDFNSYKQRYNIGLLFRGNLIDSDFDYTRSRVLYPGFFSFPFSHKFNFSNYRKFLFSSNIYNLNFGSNNFLDNSFFFYFSNSNFLLFLNKLTFHYVLIFLIDFYINILFLFFYFYEFPFVHWIYY